MAEGRESKSRSLDARAVRLGCRTQAAAAASAGPGLQTGTCPADLPPHTGQVAHGRLQEEASARAAAAEAQAKAARDEAARLRDDAAALARQLEAAQDAVKVRVDARDEAGAAAKLV
jgi:hypothetical protein